MNLNINSLSLQVSSSYHKIHQKSKEQMFNFSEMLYFSPFLVIVGLGLAAGAPAERPSYPSVKCRTEYTTVWETEYEERETQECDTKWVPECKMVSEKQCKPTSREVVSI